LFTKLSKQPLNNSKSYVNIVLPEQKNWMTSKAVPFMKGYFTSLDHLPRSLLYGIEVIL